MPKSRVHRLFDRLRRKSKDQEPSPQEWLEVDESFDARTVGAERGGWESFREDEGVVDPGATTQLDPYNAGYENGQYNTIEEDGFDGPYDYEGVDEYDDGYGPDERRPWHGGAFSPRRMEKAELDLNSASNESSESLDFDDPDVPAELKQIYQFRNPDINTEVWFVALGSELAQNGGMRAFITEHQQELRGSIIIDLDGRCWRPLHDRAGGHVPDGEDVFAYEALHQEGFASHRFERGRRADQMEGQRCFLRHQTRVPGNASGRHERSETGVLCARR